MSVKVVSSSSPTLVFIGVFVLHALLFIQLLSHNDQPALVEVQRQVIQGMLLPTPPAKILKKKPVIKKKAEKAIEKPLEPPLEEIVNLVEEVVEDVPEEEPKQQPETEVEQAVVLPPTIGDAAHLNNPAPRYPRLSKRLREEGLVILELLVLADGSVTEVKIKTSSGYIRLDKAALEAVKKWRYRPATRNGLVTAYRYQQPIEFSMK